jgi:CheY-like chemotaxis protein
MVKHSDQEAAHVVKAVLDAQASRIFMNLVRHDVGLPLLVGYLTQHAHPEITRFFVQTLRDEGYLDLAGHIETHGSGKESKPRRKVCAVDDSRMFLSIYRSVLNELGFEAELFLEPEEALSWLAGHRPSLVCTDLNMPRMNGIDLTREIRKLYDKNELPVIMVTTQSDLRDQGDAYAAGVNVIAAKPFDGKSLQAAIASCAS